MLSHSDTTGGGIQPDFPEPSWAQVLLLGVPFLGSVIGMLTMGYLGDLLGVQRALIVTNSLIMLGALASAVLSWGTMQTLWIVITASRFVLGVGVGGNYPLSAARAAETSAAKDVKSNAAKAFFWQQPGMCTPYLLGLALLRLPHTPGITSLQFRVLLGAGALPAFVVLYAVLRESTSDDDRSSQLENRNDQSSKLREALRKPHHWRTLIGTAGTWFLFDVAYYGTVIFAPTILAHVFGAQQSLEQMAWRALFIGLVSTLGTAAGICALPIIGAKALNTAGLLLGGVIFTGFCRLMALAPQQHWTLFILLCVLIFVLAWGPNVATFVLPVVAYPREVRATFHGLSAAAAKIGAMSGAMLFPVMNTYFGVPAIMAVQAAVCTVAGLLSHFCLDNEFPVEKDYEAVGGSSFENVVSGAEDPELVKN